MAPFRPSNLNKRAYPGNAGVIGPTTEPTSTTSTATVCSVTTDVCDTCACLGTAICLGCRYFGGCGSRCYDSCRCCTETTTNITFKSGMYSINQQNTFKADNKWGSGISTSAGAETEFCTITKGIANTSGTQTDCKGYYIAQGDYNGCPASTKWFVTPSTYECPQQFQSPSGTNTNWNSVNCSNVNLGSCGWFVPDAPFLRNPGWTCRSYWDCWTVGGGSGYGRPGYVSTSFIPPGYFTLVSFNASDCSSNAVWNHPNYHGAYPVRTFYSS
tara:strand:- start:7475 stop:8287 length:813 start_codon:yes stop_codon:yes gene_type:complete